MLYVGPYMFIECTWARSYHVTKSGDLGGRGATDGWPRSLCLVQRVAASGYSSPSRLLIIGALANKFNRGLVSLLEICV